MSYTPQVVSRSYCAHKLRSDSRPLNNKPTCAGIVAPPGGQPELPSYRSWQYQPGRLAGGAGTSHAGTVGREPTTTRNFLHYSLLCV
ncbi:hypothetical protein ES703_13082 [subsurface metagenome]